MATRIFNLMRGFIHICVYARSLMYEWWSGIRQRGTVNPRIPLSIYLQKASLPRKIYEGVRSTKICNKSHTGYRQKFFFFLHPFSIFLIQSDVILVKNEQVIMIKIIIYWIEEKKFIIHFAINYYWYINT